jgi:hypothetical protein
VVDYCEPEPTQAAFALRADLKLVKERTQEQLDQQALHRVRARLVARRTVQQPSIRSARF